MAPVKPATTENSRSFAAAFAPWPAVQTASMGTRVLFPNFRSSEKGERGTRPWVTNYTLPLALKKTYTLLQCCL